MSLLRDRSTGLADHCRISSAFLVNSMPPGATSISKNKAVDTTTAAGRALFQMLGVFAEFEGGIIQERIYAGLARAREKVQTAASRLVGRGIDPTREAAMRAALASGMGILKTARQYGTGTSVVQRIKPEMARAAKAINEGVQFRRAHKTKASLDAR